MYENKLQLPISRLGGRPANASILSLEGGPSKLCLGGDVNASQTSAGCPRFAPPVLGANLGEGILFRLPASLLFTISSRSFRFDIH
ncbi:MAG: hypothetical protein DMG72_06220 [Acidobacteria bacterium]|nr:MAG: hypothetical protein DMG72_06220 [Acidobacteriota bacterium]